MRKFSSFLFAGLLFYSASFGQTISSFDPAADSLLYHLRLLKMTNDTDKPSSEFKVSLGLGNNLYGNQNKAAASLQNSNLLVISPSVSYTHKSGFGIAFTGDVFSRNTPSGFFQYLLEPSYEYTTGKVIDASLYYTHFFEQGVYNTNTSPFQNEFYSTFLYKKNWLKPGIALGYSSGIYHEIVKIDTTLKEAGQRVLLKYIDTVGIKIASYTAAVTLEHEFEFKNLLANDDFTFTPQLSLIMGKNTYLVNHSSSEANFEAYSKKLLKKIKHFESQEGSQKFAAQSAALNLDLNYSIGIFYIEPTLYLDYYLPKTNDSRLGEIYLINVGVTF
jgi:hypothetical protein